MLPKSTKINQIWVFNTFSISEYLSLNIKTFCNDPTLPLPQTTSCQVKIQYDLLCILHAAIYWKIYFFFFSVSGKDFTASVLYEQVSLYV